MKFKFYFLASFFWLLATNIVAQDSNIIFSQLPSELGLNNTTITSITQDSRGQLWFGTWVGLYKYDGYNAKLYKANLNKKNSLTSNKITNILNTKNGELYVATLRGGVLKYRFEYDDFVPVAFTDSKPNSLRLNVWHLYEDKNQNIWAATERGIGIMRKGKTAFENDDTFLKSKINSKRVQFITEASSEYLWVGTEDGVFTYFIDKMGNVKEMSHYNFQFINYTQEQSNYITGIIKSKEEKYFILCKSGIIELDVTKGFEKTTNRLVQKTGLGFEFPRVIAEENIFGNKVIIGTNEGLRFLDKDDKLLQTSYLTEKVVRTIFKDNFGTLWIGTENGLFKLSLDSPLIKNFTYEGNSNLEFNTIENINFSNDKNKVWMAWQNGTLSKLDASSIIKSDNKIIHYKLQKPNGRIIKDRISQLISDDNNSLWVATQGSGILRFKDDNLSKSNTITALEVIDHTIGLYDNYVMSLAYNNNMLWFGSWNSGLYNYDILTKKISEAKLDNNINQHLKSVAIIKLLFINENTILVATRGNGIYIFNLQKDNSLVLKNLFNKESNHKLINDFITDVKVFNDQIWITSEGGVEVYNINAEKFDQTNINEFIPRSIVQSISVLNDSTVWLSTYNDGIIELNKKGNKYLSRSHLKNSLSNYASNSALRLDDKRIIFGGAGGFTLVNLENKITSDLPPKIFITGIRIENKEVTFNEQINGSIKCNKVISELPNVKLNYKDNSISIHLSSFHSSETQNVTYAYMLEGFHDDWIYTTEKDNVIHFTNLNPRNYTFKFKASNSDGFWSDVKELKIKVSPPWWLSTIAYILYAMLLVALVYGLIQLFLAKARYDHDIKLEKMERAKVEEVNQMKLKFYTTISHELRTPLTMIISPLEQLLQQKDKSDPEKSYQFILRNARKLHAMINQLLDFRKHESGNIELQLKKIDIIEFTKEVILSFQSLAARKNISLELVSSIDKLYMAFDEEQLEKLYNNLISNSLKYTANNGVINIIITQSEKSDNINIRVEDNGIGIDSKDIVHIFDRFYQGRDHVHSGYGLGLSIVKSIVEMHEGEIKVDSEKNKGTKINILIPTNLSVTDSIEDVSKYLNQREDVFIDEDEIEQLSEIETTIELRKRILIVEDNEEIKEYLKENFIADFEVSLASDGDIGLNIALAEIPDIIISDIAMDRMDGLSMCRELKSNIATSHIPIILLTARTAVDYKMEGYDLGANAYVTKPFNMELLKKQVTNLINYRDVLKSKFLNLETVFTTNDIKIYEPAMPAEEALDQKFMIEFVKLIEKKIEDSELTVDELAKDLYMSRIQIYRKVKALTGLTPNVFIRGFRLKRAAQYLRLGELSIAEITYKVGFNDLKYFREKFKDEYGVNPSEYKSSLKQV